MCLVPIPASLVVGAWIVELQSNMQADSLQLLQERVSLCHRALVRYILWMVIYITFLKFLLL